MDFTQYTCPVCNNRFQNGDDIVVCPECGAPHHRDCYEKENRCFYQDRHKEHFSFDALFEQQQQQEQEEQKPSGNIDDTPTGEIRAKTPGSDWTKTEISEGLVMWSFKGKSPITATNQIIDIVEVDMNFPRYTFHVKFHDPDSVSNIFKSTGAVVATNAGYGPVSVFIKDHGIVKSSIDLTMATDRNEPEYAWCNDGGVYGRGSRYA